MLTHYNMLLVLTHNTRSVPTTEKELPLIVDKNRTIAPSIICHRHYFVVIIYDHQQSSSSSFALQPDDSSETHQTIIIIYATDTDHCIFIFLYYLRQRNGSNSNLRMFSLKEVVIKNQFDNYHHNMIYQKTVTIEKNL
jgi:hypothetical protein